MSYIVPNHYPTICGYCGSPLVKGEDGEMHCSLMCPHWQHSVELGFNDPASFAGWTPIDQPSDTPTYPLDIHDMEMRDDELWRREQELGEKKLHLQYLQNRIPALQDEIKALSNYVTQLDRITEFHDETPRRPTVSGILDMTGRSTSPPVAPARSTSQIIDTAGRS